MNRNQVARRLGEYYSRKFRGKVWCYFDTSRRAYCIRGENLPSRIYPRGWTLVDYIKPVEARRLVADI